MGRDSSLMHTRRGLWGVGRALARFARVSTRVSLLSCVLASVLLLPLVHCPPVHAQESVELPDFDVGEETLAEIPLSLVFSQSAARPGDRLEVALVVEVPEPWHLYGPEEDKGRPTRTAFSASSGATVGDPRYPEPIQKNYVFLGGKLALYEGRVVIPAEVVVPAAVQGDELRVTATVDYQACTDMICAAPKEGITIDAAIPMAPEEAPVQSTHAGLWPRVSGLGLRAPGSGSGASGVGRPTVDAVPRQPANRTPQTADPAPAKHSSAQLTTHNPQPPARRGDGAFASALESGLFLALIACFFWGLAASLSPCVYPMIPITVSYFGGAQAREGKSSRKFFLALSYVMGMVVMYSTVGVLAAYLGRDLGAFMVNPWVIGLLAVVLIALAASMFGLYVLQLPPWLLNRLQSQGEGKSFVETFLMGLVLGFVAAPCVGPFAGSILVFVAHSGDLVLGFFSLFSFGLGMGMLFLVLALSSSFVDRLPRAGMWMVHLEHFFGYVLVGMALYLLGNVLPVTVTTLLWGLYLALGGAALGGVVTLPPEAPVVRRLARGIGILGLVAGSALVLSAMGGAGWIEWPAPQRSGPFSSGEAGSPAGIAWEHDLDAALARARAEGKPVFADFYADWCIPCKEMDARVFTDPKVITALSQYIAVKVDCTQPDSPGAVYKNRVLKSPFMPYLALFGPDGVHRPDASIEGYASTDELLAALAGL